MTLSLLSLLLACAGPPEPDTTPEAPEAALTAVAPPPEAGAPGMPDAPLYDLPLQLEDQDGQRVGLDVHRGHPTVFSMFYATCPAACPMLVAKIRELEGRLSPGAREDLRVLLVTFDPERDTPERLAALAADQHLDLRRWRLARTAPQDVRLLSAALAIPYTRLPDGEYNHGSVLVLTDREGRPVARLGSLAEDPTALLAAAEALAAD